MKYKPFDYEPVRRSNSWSEKPSVWSEALNGMSGAGESDESSETRIKTAVPSLPKKHSWIIRRGHFLSYVGLFLFTAVVYFRPYELIPALSGATQMAFWIAVVTLVIFIPSQVAIEGTLTTRPREVNLVLLLGLSALLSIPLGDDPTRSWNAFGDFSKVIVMFIVMVNVVRTEGRLKWMFFLVLAVSVYLSVNAFSDYRAGIFKSDGYRVVGTIGNHRAGDHRGRGAFLSGGRQDPTHPAAASRDDRARVGMGASDDGAGRARGASLEHQGAATTSAARPADRDGSRPRRSDGCRRRHRAWCPPDRASCSRRFRSPSGSGS